MSCCTSFKDSRLRRQRLQLHISPAMRKMSFLLCSNIKDPGQSVRPQVLIRVFQRCDVCNRIISNDSVFVCWSLRPSQSCYGISSRPINLLTFSWTGLVLQAVNRYFMHYEQRFCKRTAKGLIRCANLRSLIRALAVRICHGDYFHMTTPHSQVSSEGSR